jgi:ABC-type nickel/cobalt efflux system permease component RcnA
MRAGIPILVVLMLAPNAARAHAQYRPFSLNRYTEISFDYDSVRFTYTVTVGDIPAQRLKLKADDDGDQVLSPDEIKPLGVWMHGLLSAGLHIKLDGREIKTDPGTAKIDLLSNKVMYGPLRFRFRWRLGCGPGKHEFFYHDRARLPALEQTEVYVRQQPGMKLISVSKKTPRMFWEGGARPEALVVRFELHEEGWEEDSAQVAAPQAVPQTELEDDAGPLKRALADQRLGFWGLLGIIGFSFLLGAVHALSPGHGKTLVAAYLVGSKGKMRHAVFLGLIVTVTHVFSVVALGLVALWATQEVVPERVGPWISLAAGGLIVVMGVWMLVSRLRKKTAHAHAHEHAHGVKWTEILVLGISGGMVPCLSATVVLLFAIYVGRVLMGLLLIAAFSLGMAASLIVIGMLVVTGRDLVARWSGGERRKWVEVLPVISAGIVTVLGLVMVVSAAVGL